MIGRNRTLPSAGRLFGRYTLQRPLSSPRPPCLATAAPCFGHRQRGCSLNRPTHVRPLANTPPVTWTRMRTRARMLTNFGGRSTEYVPLSLLRTRSMYISYVPRSRGHFGGRSMYISYRTGRRRAVAGNGGAVAGNGRAVGAPCAVAGSADSAHQHRLIQQEAVAIFGLVVLWCRGAFWFLGLQRCCCDSAPRRGGVCFRVVWCER